jgi:hypothetical protein
MQGKGKGVKSEGMVKVKVKYKRKGGQKAIYDNRQARDYATQMAKSK